MLEYILAHYSWRISFQSTIIFWSDSRLFCFVYAVDTIMLSFLFLIYRSYLLWAIMLLLAILLPMIITRIMVLMLYFGKAVDLQDEDLSLFYRPSYEKLREEFASCFIGEVATEENPEDPKDESIYPSSQHQEEMPHTVTRSRPHCLPHLPSGEHLVENRTDKGDEKEEPNDLNHRSDDISYAVLGGIVNLNWDGIMIGEGLGTIRTRGSSQHSSTLSHASRKMEEGGSISDSFVFSSDSDVDLDLDLENGSDVDDILSHSSDR
jgi:hypothetical protein